MTVAGRHDATSGLMTPGKGGSREKMIGMMSVVADARFLDGCLHINACLPELLHMVFQPAPCLLQRFLFLKSTHTQLRPLIICSLCILYTLLFQWELILPWETRVVFSPPPKEKPAATESHYPTLTNN